MKTYEERVSELVGEGLSNGDAQGIADMEAKQGKLSTNGIHQLKPPCYPLRPFNGGDWEGSIIPDLGDWMWEPKYNGHRVIVHAPTGAMFCRRRMPYASAGMFSPAVKEALAAVGVFAGGDWLDCEALSLRHGLSRGAMVVFDVMDHPGTYLERRAALIGAGLAIHDPSNAIPDQSIVMPPSVDNALLPALWKQVKEHPLVSGAPSVPNEYYEGVVGKVPDSLYYAEAQSHPESSTMCWVKLRWHF